MKWFPGSINDAVTTAKQRGAIFVVFIEGKDEVSIEAARALEENENLSQMDCNDMVSVRVQEDTESFNFFKQIYGTVSVPSLYFISTNGIPLDVLTGDFSSLSIRLDAVLEKADKKQTVAVTSSQVQSQKTAAAGGAAAFGNGNTDEASDSPKSVDVAQLTTDEKIERAKRLVELQRSRKLEQEREEERKREMERRRMGKDVQSLKQKQHEAEVKMALDERMREKAATAEARERVLRQIEQDKIERKQREMALQQQVAQQQSSSQLARTGVASSMPGTSGDSKVARIQFRLPSGSPHLEKFDASSSLGALRSYVVDNIELPFREFTMSTTFPRRDLTVQDDEKTLEELELVPTAVVLILPVKNSKVTSIATTSGDIGLVSRFVWALFTPIITIYNYVIGYFGVAPINNNNNDNSSAGIGSTNAERTINNPNENAERNRRTSYDRTAGSLIGRNLLDGPSTTIRSRGNIHRLHSDGDDNDENNTWNGNSTQQM